MFEQFDVLYRGLILGLMIAAPVGPVGLLCMRRSLQHGPMMGFCTGFGAAFADAFFAALAAFGVAQITEWIRTYNHGLHIIGGFFLFAVAVHTWFDKARPLKATEDTGVGGVLKALGSGFILTVTNPMTLFGTLALVAAFGALESKWEASTLVGGIFLGSTSWWFLLSGGVALIRHHFTERTVHWVNRVTAICLCVLACWALSAGLVDGLSFMALAQSL